jgi:uncharacterized protein (DUF2336 family)
MKASLRTVIEELEGAMEARDDVFRRKTLRRVTDLFLAQSSGLGQPQIDVFDDVIGQLARTIEFRAKIDLAEQLADVPNAPIRVIFFLANEPIEIAQPVIERSPRLAEADLIKLAEEKGDDHRLAISRRDTLTPPVTDVLIDRGDDRVAITLAANEGAQFSQRGLSQLLDRARDDEDLVAELDARSDLEPSQLASLLNIARDQVRRRLMREVPAYHSAMLDHILDDVVYGLQREEHQVLGRYDASLSLTRTRALAGQLTEPMVVAWIGKRQTEDVLASFANLAGFPIQLVVRAYQSPGFEPLLLLVKAVDFGWPTLKQLLEQKAGRLLPADLMASLFEQFSALSSGTARRALRFVASRAVVEGLSRGAATAGDRATA